MSFACEVACIGGPLISNLLYANKDEPLFSHWFWRSNILGHSNRSSARPTRLGVGNCSSKCTKVAAKAAIEG